MEEYLAVEDLRTLPHFNLDVVNLISFLHSFSTAPLTETEINAIDKAGSKGPPSFLRRRLGRVVSGMLVAAYILFKIGVALFLLKRIAG